MQINTQDVVDAKFRGDEYQVSASRNDLPSQGNERPHREAVYSTLCIYNFFPGAITPLQLPCSRLAVT